ncbi:T9SS C-terminal target domain-containing protein [Chryseobacterium carnipullorum]|uniref:T9SS C-terminal target domain-containing protein n=1 Tax=Chryseobacterium carnipullorum TaxID=1124835 RepID=A0A3G6M6G7_CHRCU|nr:T9SS C-terminal target domain-containing protein [Chryseobacterium carnipullorum]AZA67809.1 T9SS C-terminal target domain-containing protein [Chryseobacterium carnipullorum]HBV16118.1 hypothetical protein [Chryseobacterium carnipullorum]
MRFQWFIFNVNGRIINSTAVSGNSINVSALIKGHYLIKLFTKNKAVSQKLIKN